MGIANWFISSENTNEDSIFKQSKVGDVIHFHKHGEACNEQCFKKLTIEKVEDG